MFDSLQEIWAGLRAHKLRTGLTALSVAWGIFMLVLLLAAGTGLERATEKNFEDDAVNSIWVWPGQASLAYQGHALGRPTKLTDDDFEAVRADIPGLEYATARFYPGGERVVRYGDQRASFDIRATHPDHRYLERTLIRDGRFLNDLDLAERRKVAVIGVDVEKVLFARASRPAVGELLDIGGIYYRIVGVFRDEGAEQEQRKIYIPITTAQTVFNGGNNIHQFMVTLKDASLANSKRIVGELRRLIARRHEYDPADKAALSLNNNVEELQTVTDIFTWMRVFSWIVGIGTVIAGVVGVSNIMLIAVKERTRELAVRKAVGATPASLIALVVQEALLITGVAGFMGLGAGLTLVEVVARFLPDNDYFRQPSVDLGGVLLATALLIVTGVLAGFFPARRAAMVHPVAALREGG